MDQQVKPNWRLFKVDFTPYVSDSYKTEHGITEVGALYLIDVNLHVHICSATPNLEGWLVQPYVQFASYELDQLNEGEAEFELFKDIQEVDYFSTDLESQHSVSAENYLPDDPEDLEDKLKVADTVREHLSGNPLAIW